MSNGNSSDNTMIWLVCAVILGCSVIANMFSTNSGGSLPSVPQSADPARNTPEYRYARERFRQEGYSSTDAETAASAVYKFHQAQQARR